MSALYFSLFLTELTLSPRGTEMTDAQMGFSVMSVLVVVGVRLQRHVVQQPDLPLLVRVHDAFKCSLMMSLLFHLQIN